MATVNRIILEKKILRKQQFIGKNPIQKNLRQYKYEQELYVYDLSIRKNAHKVITFFYPKTVQKYCDDNVRFCCILLYTTLNSKYYCTLFRALVGRRTNSFSTLWSLFGNYEQQVQLTWSWSVWYDPTCIRYLTAPS